MSNRKDNKTNGFLNRIIIEEEPQADNNYVEPVAESTSDCAKLEGFGVFATLPDNNKKKRLFLIASTVVVVLAIVVAVIIRTCVLVPMTVRYTSMLPLLHENDTITVLKCGYTIKHGDVIVFEREESEKANGTGEKIKNVVKRVIAMEGDRISITTMGVYINDILLNEQDYLNQTAGNSMSVFFPVNNYIVPEGHLFVMGDNRLVSIDSRHYGAISVDIVIGKVVNRISHFD